MRWRMKKPAQKRQLLSEHGKRALLDSNIFPALHDTTGAGNEQALILAHIETMGGGTE